MTPILNKIYRFLTVASLLFLTAACNDGFDVPENLVPDSPGTITLHLKSSNLTRSEDSDNASNPETAIKNLCIVFYKKSLGGGLTPGGGVIMGGGETSQDERALEMIVIPESDLVDVNDQYTYTLRLTDERKKKFFGENGEDGCDFFVLANITDLDNVPENVTVEELKEWVIKTDFTKPQASFVMAGEGTVEYTSPTTGGKKGSASGSALLIRAAAKIQLNVKFTTESVTVNEEQWKPIEGGIKVLINNGVKESIAVPEGLNGMPWKPGLTQDPTQEPSSPDDELEMLSDMDDEGENASDPYYSSSLKNAGSVRSLSKATSSEGNPDYPYQMDVPFYTYPNAWEESAEETHKTTLTLVVPWHKDGDPEGSNYTFYYQVPVTPDITFITRNTSYNIYLNVGMLGSLVPDEPLELTDLSYKIVDWSDENINVEINDYRYLVVNPNVYTINNEEEFSIPFYTSHECEISDITMTYQRFNYYSKKLQEYWDETEEEWVSPNNRNYAETVDITMSKDVIDKSTSTYSEQTKICDYTIEEDPVSNLMTIKIKHPFTMWVPLDENNEPVSLTLQKEESVTATDKIDHYAYPTDVQLGEAFTDEEGYDQYKKYDVEPAYFPYKITVSIWHKDNHLFNETVTITQYPGMYIVADKNVGDTYFSYEPITIKGRETPQDNNYGNTFLNPSFNSETNAWKNSDIVWDHYDNIKEINDLLEINTDEARQNILKKVKPYKEKGLGGLRPYDKITTVANPNMYLINITQLSEKDGEYIIGDPRSKFINNELSGETGKLGESRAEAKEWCQPATSVSGETRRLKYYYPTNEDDAYKMMVAPKIRIASAYGTVRVKSDIINAMTGRRRVATYQEQGRPAGRWRLPTYGEVKFIVKLAAEYKIPILFNINETYLTAQGPYKILNTGELEKGDYNFDYTWIGESNIWRAKNNMGVYVRGVYDEWYWGDETVLKNVYTYGDMPIKSN